ncbi:hypothetical protein [Prolixibacter denitrificans]|uniref:Uncharacterized protein n=1 Tax=Prolixibacter denitrificans TaxID=1541063 RepID=A0A2P8CH35_9BACT|nr:hypothetical protein [Prolixibacter denitrificans]PSK84297.1 hypothetical protein CLV93_10282 [Prolixibacter denitrificans]
MENNSDNRYRCITKGELAKLCGVSATTVRTWLNIRYYPELKKLGYFPRQKILLPPQVRFLVDKLVIIEDDSWLKEQGEEREESK